MVGLLQPVGHGTLTRLRIHCHSESNTQLYSKFLLLKLLKTIDYVEESTLTLLRVVSTRKTLTADGLNTLSGRKTRNTLRAAGRGVVVYPGCAVIKSSICLRPLIGQCIRVV